MRNIFTYKNFLLGLVVIASVVTGLVLVGTFSQVQGEKFVYLDGDKAYVSSISSDPVKVADNVQRILDSSNGSSRILYLSSVAEKNIGGQVHGSKLIVMDPATGNERVIAENIVEAKFSPDGTRIVAQSGDYKIRLFTAIGKEITRIGMHGSAPLFSHDGAYIAYHKLADEGEGFRLFEFSPYGIVLYNLATGEEELITDNKDDFQPVGFSLDMSRLYFNSGRKYGTSPEGFENHVASLWMVDLTTKEIKRLTNMSEEVVRQGIMVPTVDGAALWSSDRKMVISSVDPESGTWQFVFNQEGELARAERITDGTSPHWLVPDKNIVVRTKVDGKGEWKTVNIK
ncbi:hypothetical protein HY839_04705 [Candidatus Azambacteria bacterium]|nr:hypothetical protein [Candidatus Azambacteria bacterium]